MRYSLTLRGVEDSRTFATALRSSGLLIASPDGHHGWRPAAPGAGTATHRDDAVTELAVSFSGAQTIKVQDLSVIALLIRFYAEQGIPVHVQLPRHYRGEPSGLAKVLRRIGFVALLEPSSYVNDWRGKLRLSGAADPLTHPELDIIARRYVPLQWIDKSWFDRDSDQWLDSRIWLKPAKAVDLEKKLARMGFENTDAVSAFVHTLVLEIGSNAVIHSAPNAGEGLALLSGHIAPSDGHLDFAIADAGLGIPLTLGRSYAEWITEQGSDFHTSEQCSPRAGSLRFALERFSTRREVTRSRHTAHSDRGLGVVRDIIEGGAQLTLRSDGGLVRIEGGREPLVRDVSVVPGTQAVGLLPRAMRAGTTRLEDGAIRLTLPHLTAIPAYRIESRTLVSLRDEQATEVVALADPQEPATLIDLGGLVEGHKSIEALINASAARDRHHLTVFWNSDVHWETLGAAGRRARRIVQAGGMPPLVVRSCQDARFLGVHTGQELLSAAERSPHRSLLRHLAPFAHEIQNTSDAQAYPYLPVALETDSYLTTCAAANSEYLEQGFTRAGEPCGFFRGKIFLPSGGHVDRYFALGVSLKWAPGSLTRWTRFAEGALHALRDSSDTTRPLVLIGFTAAVFDVLSGIAQQVSGSLAIYGLNPYDVPTREEVRGIVKPNADVILLTDVVSSGSLTSAIADVVRDVGGNLLGIVSLVDARKDVVIGTNRQRFGRGEVAYYSGARLRHGDLYSAAVPLESELRVDPVSLVPTRRPGRSAARDPRISHTLDLVAHREIASCGHILDGSRHGSVFIHVSRLLDLQAQSVRLLVNQEIDKRMSDAGWEGFSPTLLLRPSGVGRVERLRTSEGIVLRESLFPSAAQAFTDTVIAERWPKAAILDIPRTFDPAGRSRSAHAVEPPSGVPHRDVVVADDGMWSGRTTQALAQRAASLGAERVLIIPLLARMTSDDIAYWESLAELRIPTPRQRGAKASGARLYHRPVRLCYVFPLLLPIPYYEEHDCPYELTAGRLRHWSGVNDVLARFAHELAERLEGRRPEDAANHSERFSRTWVTTRARVELAAESEAELDQLRDFVLGADDNDDLLAIFTLFLEDWRLLGRARLRRTLAEAVRDSARRAILAASTSSHVRASAVSLLRSLFPDHFAELLPQLVEATVHDPETLGRMIFHVGTLAATGRESAACQEFLRRLSLAGRPQPDTVTSEARDAQLQAYHTYLSAARSLLFGLSYRRTKHTLVEAADHLRSLLLEDSQARHEALAMMHGLSAGENNLQHFDADLAQGFFQQWRAEHRPFIVSQVLPSIETLRGCLTSISREDRLLPDAAGTYLVTVADPRRGILADLGVIEAGLEVLAESRSISSMNAELARAASRLKDNVLGRKSTLGRYLEELRSTTVGALLDAFVVDLRSRFSLVREPIDVDVPSLDHEFLNRPVFCSPHLLHSIVRSIADNIETHGYRLRLLGHSPYTPADGRRLVAVQAVPQRSASGEPTLLLTIFNNGVYLDETRGPGRATRRLGSDLAQFGGEYAGVLPVDGDWSAVHQVRFLTW